MATAGTIGDLVVSLIGLFIVLFFTFCFLYAIYVVVIRDCNIKFDPVQRANTGYHDG